MSTIEQLLLNIKMTHKQIVEVGKMDLDPKEKAKILHNLDSEKVSYEAALFVALAREQSEQPTTG